LESDSGSTDRARMMGITRIALIPRKSPKGRVERRMSGVTRGATGPWLLDRQPAPGKKERLMRSLRFFVAVLGLMALVVSRGMAADYAPKDLLKFRPTQPGVDYDTPADAAAIDACKVELVTDGQKRTVGYALRDGQGKLLRRFVITNGGKFLNQWSYYQD